MLRIDSMVWPRECIASARSWLWGKGESIDQPSAQASRCAHWVTSLGLTLLSSALICIAFPKTAFGFAALVALAPLFHLWSRLTWKQALLWGWLSGTITYLLLLDWLGGTVFQFVGSWSMPMLIVVCGIEALTIAGVALIASLVGRGTFRPVSIIAIPSAWLLFESLRSYGSLGIPFGALGHVAAHLPWLLPLASFGGVYILTFIIAVVNAAAVAIVSEERTTRSIGIGTLLTCAIGIMAAGIHAASMPVPAPSLRVAIAQGNISQRTKWTQAGFDSSLATYFDLTREAARNGARVVVWPETAIALYPLQNPKLRRSLETLAATTHAWIISGSLDEPTEGTFYNSVLDLTPAGAVGGIYHKRWLMPFAEFLPFAAILRHIRSLNESASDYRAGSGPRLLPAGGLKWGSLICYESGFALYARAMVQAGADVIAMVADDDWFADTKEPYQHADVTVVEAVSTGRWIVRSTQSGISEFVDPKGNITASLGLKQRGVIFANVGRGIDTFYDRYGALWLFVLSALAVVCGVASSWRIRR